MDSDRELFAEMIALIERKRDAATAPAIREFWHRLLGNVRKASNF